MSSPAAPSEAAPRVLVVDDGAAHEVFDVLGINDGVIRVRSAFLFEIGEQLAVRIEQDGAVSEATARVRAHVGPADAPITELELRATPEPAEPAPAEPAPEIGPPSEPGAG